MRPSLALANGLLASGLLVSACRAPAGSENESQRSTTAPTNSASTESTAAAIDALIERSKHMDSLDASYRMRSPDDEDKRMDMRLAFQRGVGLAVIVGEAPSAFGFYNYGDLFSMRVRDENGDAMSADGDIDNIVGTLRRDLARVAAVELPSLQLTASPVRFCFEIERPRPDAAEHTFGFNLSVLDADDSSLFGWLYLLKNKASTCRLHDGVITLDLSTEVELDVSADSGLITSVRGTRAGKTTEILKLATSDTSGPIDPIVFRAPPRDPSAKDQTANVGQMLADNAVTGCERSLCNAFAREVDRGTLVLDDANRAKLSRVLLVLQADAFDLRYGPWMRSMKEGIGDLGTWIAAQNATDHSADPAQVDTAVVDWKKKLTASLDELEGRTGHFHLARSAVASDELRTVLETIVRESELTGFRAQVSRPLLARFDGRVNEALAGERASVEAPK